MARDGYGQRGGAHPFTTAVSHRAKCPLRKHPFAHGHWAQGRWVQGRWVQRALGALLPWRDGLVVRRVCRCDVPGLAIGLGSHFLGAGRSPRKTALRTTSGTRSTVAHLSTPPRRAHRGRGAAFLGPRRAPPELELRGGEGSRLTMGQSRLPHGGKRGPVDRTGQIRPPPPGQWRWSCRSGAPLHSQAVARPSARASCRWAHPHAARSGIAPRPPRRWPALSPPVHRCRTRRYVCLG